MSKISSSTTVVSIKGGLRSGPYDISVTFVFAKQYDGRSHLHFYPHFEYFYPSVPSAYERTRTVEIHERTFNSAVQRNHVGTV